VLELAIAIGQSQLKMPIFGTVGATG